MSPPSAISSMTMKRIHREISDLKKEEMGGMTLGPSEESLFNWHGSIPGPTGSCYEGGLFRMDITLPQDYPFSAPKVTFTTRIYHMNISDRGNVCIDLLKNNWSPALSLYKVLLSLSSLLTDPNPKDPLVPQIAKEYVRDRAQHNKTAAHWTQLYALPPKPKLSSQSKTSSKPVVGTTPSQQSELIVIEDSPERPAKRKRERAPDHEDGRRKRPHRNAAATGSGAGTSSSNSARNVIVIDDE